MYKKKYLKYKTKYLDLTNQLGGNSNIIQDGGGPTAAELELEAKRKRQLAEEVQKSSLATQEVLLTAQKASLSAQIIAKQTKAKQLELEQIEINNAIQIAEGQLINMRLSIQETEGRLLKAQEKRKKMLQIVDDARKQLIKVAEEQKDKNKFLLSLNIELEQLITKLLEKGFTDSRRVLLLLEAIKQEALAKVETTPEAQKQPTTLQEALVKLYRVLKELLLDIQIEENEQGRINLNHLVHRQQELVNLMKKKAQVIKEKMTPQLLENGNLLLNDYLQIGSDDTEQLTNIIINPTKQFYTKNNFTGNMLANMEKNVFIVLKKLFNDTFVYEPDNRNYILQNIKLPVGILINFIENQIYVIIQEIQYSDNLMKSYLVEKLSDFDKNDIYRKVTRNLYIVLMNNLKNCLEESKNVIELLTNNNNLLSEIETQINKIYEGFH